MIKLIFGFFGFILAIGVFTFLSDYFENLYNAAPGGSIKESLYRAIAITSIIMTGFLIVFDIVFIITTIVGIGV